MNKPTAMKRHYPDKWNHCGEIFLDSKFNKVYVCTKCFHKGADHFFFWDSTSFWQHIHKHDIEKRTMSAENPSCSNAQQNCKNGTPKPSGNKKMSGANRSENVRKPVPANSGVDPTKKGENIKKPLPTKTTVVPPDVQHEVGLLSENNTSLPAENPSVPANCQQDGHNALQTSDLTNEKRTDLEAQINESSAVESESVKNENDIKDEIYVYDEMACISTYVSTSDEAKITETIVLSDSEETIIDFFVVCSDDDEPTTQDNPTIANPVLETPMTPPSVCPTNVELNTQLNMQVDDNSVQSQQMQPTCVYTPPVQCDYSVQPAAVPSHYWHTTPEKQEHQANQQAENGGLQFKPQTPNHEHHNVSAKRSSAELHVGTPKSQTGTKPHYGSFTTPSPPYCQKSRDEDDSRKRKGEPATPTREKFRLNKTPSAKRRQQSGISCTKFLTSAIPPPKQRRQQKRREKIEKIAKSPKEPKSKKTSPEPIIKIPVPVLPSEYNPMKEYLCLECCAAFLTERALEKHYNQNHLGTSLDAWKCMEEQKLKTMEADKKLRIKRELTETRSFEKDYPQDDQFASQTWQKPAQWDVPMQNNMNSSVSYYPPHKMPLAAETHHLHVSVQLQANHPETIYNCPTYTAQQSHGPTGITYRPYLFNQPPVYPQCTDACCPPYTNVNHNNNFGPQPGSY